MKKAIFLVSMLLVQSTLFATNTITSVVPPQEVLKNFAGKYPHITDAQWGESAGLFSAEFEDNDGFYKSATYSEKGEWINTQYEVIDLDIPDAINDFVETKYTNVEYFSYGTKLESPEGEYFELHFETNEEFIKIQITAEGKLLDEQTTPIVDEDEEYEEDDPK